MNRGEQYSTSLFKSRFSLLAFSLIVCCCILFPSQNVFAGTGLGMYSNSVLPTPDAEWTFDDCSGSQPQTLYSYYQGGGLGSGPTFQPNYGGNSNDTCGTGYIGTEGTQSTSSGYVTSASKSIAFGSGNPIISFSSGAEVLNNSFTISTWVYINCVVSSGSCNEGAGTNLATTGTFTGYNLLVDQSYSYQDFLGMELDCFTSCGTSSATYNFVAHVPGSTSLTLKSTFTITNGSGTGQWYNLVLTRTGTTVAFYINNRLEALGTFTGSLNQHGNWQIGGYSGQMDHLQMWTSALTEAQLQLIWNQRPAYHTSYPAYAYSSQRLLAYWSFAESSSPSIDNGGLGTVTGANLNAVGYGGAGFAYASSTGVGTSNILFFNNTVGSNCGSSCAKVVPPVDQRLEVGAGPFSVSFWIYPVSTGNTQYLVNYGNNLSAVGGARAFVVEMGPSSVSGQAYILGHVDATSGLHYCTYTASIATYNFYHVVVERDNMGAMKLFINGQYVSSNASSSSLGTGYLGCEYGTGWPTTLYNGAPNGTVNGGYNSAGGSLTSTTSSSINAVNINTPGYGWSFGADPNGYFPYRGYIEWMRIYNYALNIDEIENLHLNFVQKPLQTNLVGQWSFNEMFCLPGSSCAQTNFYSGASSTMVNDHAGVGGAPGMVYSQSGMGYVVGPQAQAAGFQLADGGSGNTGRVMIPITGQMAVSTGNFSFAFWLRRLPNMSSTQNLLSMMGTQTTPAFTISMNTSRQIVVKCASSGVTTTSAALPTYTTTSGSSTETQDLIPWAHIAVIRSSSSTMTIYVNGVASGTATTGCTDNFALSTSNINYLQIGRWMNGSGSTAAISDLRWYSSAISTGGTTSQLYTLATLGGRRIAARYNFDDVASGATYTAVADQSGNGNSLGVYASPTAVASYNASTGTAMKLANSGAGLTGSPTFDFARNNFAVSFWTNTASITSGGGFCAGGCIIGTADPSVTAPAVASNNSPIPSAGWSVYLNSSGNPVLRVFDYGQVAAATQPQSSTGMVTSSVVVSPNTWYHITAQRTNTSFTNPAGVSQVIVGGLLSISVNSYSATTETAITTNTASIADPAGNNYLNADSYSNGACNGNSLEIGNLSCVGYYGNSSNPAYIDDLRFYRDYVAPSEVDALSIPVNLVGWWKFDDCAAGSSCTYQPVSSASLVSTSYYYSNNVYSKGLRGSALNVTAGSGITLDNTVGGYGTGQVDSNVPGGISLGMPMGSGDFTLAYWVYFPTAPSGGPTVLSTRGYASQARVELGQTGGALFADIGDGSYTTVFGTGATTSTAKPLPYPYQDGNSFGSSFAAGRWYHIAIQRDPGSQMHLFVNGVDQYGVTAGIGINDANIDAVVNNGQSGWTLGSNGYGISNTNAVYDDVRLYNYAVPAARIVQLSTPVGMVGYWKFNESSGTTANDAVSLNSPWGTLPGTTVGLPAFTTAGQRQGALTLNGSSQYVTMPTSYALAAGDLPFTYAIWVKPSTSASAYQVIFNSVSSTNASGANSSIMQLGGAVNGSTANLEFRTANNTLFSNGTITLGQWNHIVMMRDDTNTMRIYINGVADATCSVSSCPANDIFNAMLYNSTATPKFYIGNSVDSTGYFNGSVDDARYYNRALTATEVTNLYTMGANNDGRVGYYQFEQGSGTTANDSSNWGNNLAISSVGSWTTGVRGGGYAFNSSTSMQPSNSLYATGSPSNFDEFHVGSSDFTMAAWINLSGTQNGGENAIIHEGSASDSFDLDYNGSANTVHCGCAGSGVDYTVNSGNLPTGWHHVACSRSMATSNNLILYWDGVAVATTTAVGSINSGWPPVYDFSVGTDPAYPQTINGSVDEVRFYDYALSANQIAVIAHRPQLQALWRMNQAGTIASGTTVTDSGPNNLSSITTFVGSGSTVPTWASGVRGNAINFPSGATMDIKVATSDTTLRPGDMPFSMGAWIKQTARQNWQCPIWLNANGNATLERTSICINVNGYVELRVGNTGNNQNIQTTATSVALNTWYYIAGVRDNSGYLNVYILPQGTVYTSSNMPTPAITLSAANINDISLDNQNFIMGCAASDCLPGTVEQFTGSIDDPRFYTYAISTTELAMLAQTPQEISNYSFSDTTGTDGAAAGQTGTFSGSSISTWGVRGSGLNIASNTANFNTKSYNLLQQLGDQSFGISFWVYPTSFSSSVSLLSSGNASGNNMLLTSNTSGYLTFTINGVKSDNPVDAITSSAVSLTTGSALSLNSWNHVLLMRDELGYISVWLNGIQSVITSTGNQNWSFDNSSGIWYLGNNYNLNQGAYIGGPTTTANATTFSGWNFDEFRIYNRVLNPNEIYTLALPPQIVAYWKMDSDSTCASTGGVKDAVGGYLTPAVGTTNGNNATCLAGSTLSTIATFESTNAVRGSAMQITSTGTNSNANLSTNTNSTSGAFVSPSAVSASANMTASQDPLKFMDQGFTYAAWIYVPSSISVNIVIASSGSGYSGSWTAFYVDTNGRLNFQIYGVPYNNPFGAYGSTLTVTSPGTLNNGAWNHVAIVRSDSSTSPTYTLYINGAVSTSVSGQAPFSSADSFVSGFHIADNQILSATSIQTILDDVRVYNYGVSANEIAIISALPQEVAHWKLDETGGSTTIYDVSGNGFNGTATGFAHLNTDQVSGVRGNALTYESTSYINMGTGALLHPGNLAFTWTGWVNPTAYNPNYGVFMYMGADSLTSGSFGTETYAAVSPSGQIHLRIGPDYILSSITAPVNTWTSFAVGRSDTGAFFVYVNGVQDPSPIVTYTTGSTATPINVNGGVTGSNHVYLGNPLFSGSSYVGMVDDIRVFNYALSASQIYSLGLPPQLVGYWNFNNASSGTCASTAPTDSVGLYSLTTTCSGTTSASYTTNAARGSALSFASASSNAYVATPSVTSSASTDALKFADQGFTYSAWINVPSTISSNIYVISNGGTSGNFSNLYVNTSGNLVMSLQGTQSNNPLASAQTITLTSTSAVSLGGWTHIALQRADMSSPVNSATPVTYTLFINGVASGSLTTTAATANLSVDSFSSGYHFGNSNALTAASTGLILDEVRFYNYAISQNELTRLGTPPSLVGFYKFEEGTGTTSCDMSGSTCSESGSTVATLTGSSWLTTSANEIRGSGLTVGSSAGAVASVPYSAKQQLGDNAFTIAAWVYIPTFSGTQNILSSGTSTSSTYYQLALVSGYPTFTLYGPAFNNPLASYQTVKVTSGTSATAGQWQHIAMSRSDATTAGVVTYTFYLNGSPVTSTLQINGATQASNTTASAYASFNNTSVGHQIGNGPGLTASCSACNIDEVRIYSRAVSAAEIGRLALVPQAVGYYPMDSSNTSTIAADSSPGGGASQNGTLIDASDSSGAFAAGNNWVTGFRNNGLSFQTSAVDTAARVDIPATISNNPLTPVSHMWLGDQSFSVTLAVQFSTLPSALGRSAYLISEGSTDSSMALFVDTNNHINFTITGIANNNPIGTAQTLTSSPGSTTFQANQWYVVTLVRNEIGVYNIYVDTTAVHESSPEVTLSSYSFLSPESALAVSNAGAQFHIGNNHGSYSGSTPVVPANSAAGAIIDEVRLYNYAISVAQKTAITTSYQMTGWWRLNESGGSANILDSSGQGFNGTASGFSNLSGDQQLAVRGNGLNLEGNGSAVTVPAESLLTPFDQAFTWGLWVKPTALPSGSNIATLLWTGSDGSASGQNATYLGINSSGYIVYQVGYNATALVTTTNALVVNQWHHIVASRGTDSYLRIYIDGTLVATSSTGNISNINTSNTFNLGVPNSISSTAQFNGVIDEVRAYNYALSTVNIQLLAQRPQLIGYWKLDETGSSPNWCNGGATYACDSSGNSITANLVSFGSPASDWVSAIHNNGLVFDNSSAYLNIPNNQKMYAGDQSFTWATWVYVPSSPSSYQELVFESFTSGSILQCTLSNMANNFAYIYCYDSANTNATLVIADPNQGRWNHFALVKDESGYLNMYINGSLQSTSSSPSTTYFYSGSAPMRIYGPVSGALDDLRYYNYALTASQINALSLSPEMVGYWKFDNNLNDYSGVSGQNGTLTGTTLPSYTASIAGTTPTSTSVALRNVALNFAGASANASADVTNGFGLPLLDRPFTMMLWVKPTAFTKQQYLVSTGGSGSKGSMGIFLDTSGYVNFTITGPNFGNPVDVTTLNTTMRSSSPITTGTWHHIAVQRTEAGQWQMYVDCSSASCGGTAATSATAVNVSADPTPAEQYDVHVGNDPTKSYAALYSTIDEVRIYNRVLAQDEIKIQANALQQVALWHFDESNDSGAPPVGDSSPNVKQGGCVYNFSTTDTSNGVTSDRVAAISNNGLYWAANNNEYVSTNNGDCTGTYVTDYTRLADLPMTAAGWIKLTDTATDHTILYSGNPTSNSTWRFKVAAGGYLNFEVDHRLSNFPTSTVVVQSSAPVINAGVFTYVGVTRNDDSTISLWVNGSVVATGSANVVDTTDLNHGIYIGNLPGDTYSFVGTMDEMQIYNYPLNAAQMQTAAYRAEAVGWWRFDDGVNTPASTTAVDSSVFNNTGTVQGSTAGWNEGEFDGAYQFNGSGYFDMPNLPQYAFGTAAFSVSAWIRFDSYPASANCSVIAQWGSNSSYSQANYWSLSACPYGSAASFQFETIDKVHGSYKVQKGFLSSGVIPLYTWVHLVAARDSSGGLHLYLNGTELVENTSQNSGSTTNLVSVASGGYPGDGDLRIGAESTVTTLNGFVGAIDDFRLYNYQLSSSQISILAQKPVIEARYKLDDSNSLTASDATSNGLNGTLTNLTASNWLTTSGVFGGALNFNTTNNYINVPSNPVQFQMGQSAFTVMAWVKTSSLTNNQVLFAYGTPGVNTSYWEASLISTGGVLTPKFYLQGFDGGPTTYAPTGTSATIQANQWTHIAYKRAGDGTITIYVNGVSMSSTSKFLYDVTGSTGTLTIGNYPGGSNYFRGYLDEVRVYRRDLTDQEVQAQYNLNLVGAWTYDNASNIGNDDGGVGINGTLSGVTSVLGEHGNAASFNSSSSGITVGVGSQATNAINRVLMFEDQPFSISTWVYSTGFSYQGGSASNTIAAFGTEVNTGYINSPQAYHDWVLDTDTSGNVRFTVNDYQIGATVINSSSSGVSLSANAWHQIVATRDDSQILHLYVDGQQVAYSSSPAKSNVSNLQAGALYIGNVQFGTNNAWAGYIDETKLYNRQLSAGEVSALYTGMIGYWAYDDLSGTSAADSSGNGNTGTITGGTFQTDGKFSGALLLSGSSQYVNMGTSSTLRMSKAPFTFSTWVRFPNTNWTTNTETIVNIGASGSSGSVVNNWKLYVSAGNLIFATNGQGNSNQVSASLSGWVHTGQWHMVTAKRDSAGTLYVFLDGNLLQSQTNSSVVNLIDNGPGMVVGADSSLTSNFLNSEVDDMRMYNYALSNNQIMSLYTTMVGYWKFDSNSNDSSGVSNNGTINVAEYVAPGQIGQAARFNVDTTNYMTVPMSDTLQLASNPFTVSAWVQPNGTGKQNIVMSGNTGSGPYFNLYLLTLGSTNTNSSLGVYMQDGGGHSLSLNTTGDTITGGSWHHVAMVRSSNGSVTLYIDGGAAASTTSSVGAVNLTSASQPIYVAAAGNSNVGLVGLVDDMRIYNRALAATDISNLYQGLVGYWSMNGSTNYTAEAIDSSSSNNIGNLMGGLTSSNSWTVGTVNDALTTTGGSESVYVGNSHEVQIGSNPFAVALSVKPSATNSTQYLAHYGAAIDGSGNLTGPGWFLRLESGSAGKANVRYGISDGITATSVVSTTAPISTTAWHTVVAQRGNDAALQLYVDSNAVGTALASSMSNVTNSPGTGLYIANNSSGSAGLAGSIEQVQLYNQPLNTLQLDQLGVGVPSYFTITGPTTAIRCAGAQLVITAMSATGQPVTAYQGTVTLSTQSGKGTWTLTPAGGNTGTLAQQGSSDSGLASYAFSANDNGVLYATLTYSDGNSPVTPLVYDQSTPTITSTVSPTIAFYASGFTITGAAVTSNGSSPLTLTPIANNTAGNSFPVYITAYGTTATDPTCGIITSYSGNKVLNVNTVYSNPTTADVNGGVSVNNAASQGTTLAFTDGETSFTAHYQNTGVIGITATDTNSPPTGTITGSSNLFVSAPAYLELIGTTSSSGTYTSYVYPRQSIQNSPTEPVIAKTGQAFGVTVAAFSSSGLPCSNFGLESPQQGISVVKSYSLVSPAGGRNGTTGLGTIGGTLTLTAGSTAYPTSSGNINLTSFSSNNLTFDEVGIIALQYHISTGNFLGAGDVYTNDSEPVGRFTPDHFALTSTQSGVFNTYCSIFNYLGEPFNFATVPQITVTAMNSNGVQTQNYTGSFNNLPTSLSATGNAYSFTSSSTPAGVTFDASNATSTLLNFSNGQGIYQLGSGAGFVYDKPTGDVPIVPFSAAIGYSFTLADSDGVSYSNGAPFSVTGLTFNGGSQFRHGRYYLSNGYGSDVAPLNMNLAIQYYTSTGFVTNTDDSCTALPSSASLNPGSFPSSVSFAPAAGGSSSTHFYEGQGVLTLSAPTGGLSASEQPYVDVTLGLNNSFLGYVWPYYGSMVGKSQTQAPMARAFFNGAYSPNNLMEQHEIYNESGM